MFFSRKLLDQYEMRIKDQAGHYEARIEQLKDQISDLKQMVHNQTSATHLSPIALEQDAILSQKEETITISEEELAKIRDIESEADRIFAGNY